MDTKLTEQKKTFDDIVKFYDFAEQMIDAVEEEKDPTEGLKVIEPFVNQIEESTEILVEVYMRFVDTGKKPQSYEKQRAERAIRKLYSALNKLKLDAKKLH